MRSSTWFSYLYGTLNGAHAKIRMKSATVNEASMHVGSLIYDIVDRDAAVYLVGNGGSAAACSHISQDLLNKLGVRSLAIGDAGLLTCIANDYGFENVFSKPLESLLRSGDMLIAVSSSGESEDIFRACQVAGRKGASVVTLSAFSPDNRLFNEACDVAFYLPTNIYGIAEVGHLALLHAILDDCVDQGVKKA